MTTTLTNILLSEYKCMSQSVSIRSDIRYISDKILEGLKVVLDSQTYNARRDVLKKIKQKQTNKETNKKNPKNPPKQK